MKNPSRAPWRYEPEEVQIVDADGRPLAIMECFKDTNPPEELPYDSNGYLMAAAPMIYGALRGLMMARTGEEIKEARRHASLTLLYAKGIEHDDE
jgi:hypothetical protein